MTLKPLNIGLRAIAFLCVIVAIAFGVAAGILSLYGADLETHVGIFSGPLIS